MKKVNGCTHLIINKGKITNVFTHLNIFPVNGVIHLKGDKIYSFEEFKKTHSKDHKELKKHKKIVNIEQF